MTRINVGIPAEMLCDQHLLAEHRELIRIPNCVIKGRYDLKDQPQQFTLGKGHVKFFYDKQLFLLKRYQALHDECIERGFKVKNYEAIWEEMPPKFMNDWLPKPADIVLIQQRINERIAGMRNARHSRKKRL